MSRRRTLVSGLLAAGVVALVAVLALLPGGGDDGAAPAGVDPAATAYARTWDDTCRALQTDALRTAATVRRRLGERDPGRAARRALARTVLAPYLGRTERRLLRIAAATPPAAWRAYHRAAAPVLRATAERTAAARVRARAGDAAAAADGLRAGVPSVADAPDALRARTPSCLTAGAV